jgi:hypothetical protein
MIEELISSQNELGARLFMVYWDYLAFEDCREILEQEKRRVLARPFDLTELSRTYGLDVSTAQHMVEDYVNLLFSVEYHRDEKVGYHLSTLQDVKQFTQQTLAFSNLSYENEIKLRVALQQNEAIKKAEEEDIEKIVEILHAKGQIEAFQLGQVDKIKRERFRSMQRYLDYRQELKALSEDIIHLVALSARDNMMLFLEDYFDHNLAEEFNRMYAKVYENQAKRIFR